MTNGLTDRKAVRKEPNKTQKEYTIGTKKNSEESICNKCGV